MSTSPRGTSPRGTSPHGVTPRTALWIDGACGLLGAGVHVGYAALGGFGIAPGTWRIFAIVSVVYAAIAWASTQSRAPHAGLTRMIWLNRGWVVFCVIAAAALATGFARALLAGEAAVVGALAYWEARVRNRNRVRDRDRDRHRNNA